MEYITDIIIAALAFAGTLAGSLLASSKSQAVLEERVNGIKEDINTLSERVDKHNHLNERLIKVEERCKSNTHRLNSIEEKGDE